MSDDRVESLLAATVQLKPEERDIKVEYVPPDCEGGTGLVRITAGAYSNAISLMLELPEAEKLVEQINGALEHQTAGKPAGRA